ncbi:uncharacterized protein MKK02DRAFT_37997 [Dioszegia hungarica]|uniref:Nucleic acid-binding protein n=1 Tax=Dioszegia hungarica TaxID=4972 RepID=A0AA38LRE4_9TREE|nr:uncharacterized protein MKK02DRAFT_37997 [Dioszegia hungarica]KAI9634467.1 hypothetical protein MKK02DRAFT_37997 [Dioszegia hungarica]
MLASTRSSLLQTASAAKSRGFASSARKLDLSKVVLLGRLGNDPVLRTTSSGKPYYSYNVATSTGPPKEEEGRTPAPSTVWHTVFAFNEGSHAGLARVGKGSSVYVEADLEMRPTQSSDGQTQHDRALLRHLTMRVISRVKPAGEEDSAADE